jgi:peptide/nickel transport system substrate-binding protein
MSTTERIRRPLALVAVLGLVVAAGAAARGGAADRPRGGTLQLAAGGFPIDPTTSFASAVLNTTQLVLYSYPDTDSDGPARLVPQAAVGMPHVSRDGKTYTFTVRDGLRFSDGAPVTAASFAFSLNRAMRPELGAYVGSLLRDVVGVHAQGQTLTVELSRRAGDLPARLAMGNLGALPLDFPPEEVTTAPVVSAGPYYVKEYVPGDHALLARNPYWNRDAIPDRPANVDAIRYTFGLPSAEVLARVERGELDYTVPGLGAQPGLAERYGVNQGRLFSRPAAIFDYLAFNHDRPLFRDNVALKRAINFAVDRAAIVGLAPLAATATDQFLTPTMPGYADADLYPLAGPDLERARKLARGALRGGRAVIWAGDTAVGPQIAEIVRANLAQIGIVATVEVLDVGEFFDRLARRGEPWDIAVAGWFSDYLDPQNTFEPLFHGRSIAPVNSLTVVYLDDSKWNRRIDDASELAGAARERSFAKLDRQLMREEAPGAPLVAENAVGFTSARVGCVSFHPLGFLDYAAVCLR